MDRPPPSRCVVAVRDPFDERAVTGLLEAAGAEVRTAAGAVDVTGADLLVVDEWTAETAPHVVAARAGGVRVSVPAQFVLERAEGPVLAITGTAGKSTATALAAAVMRAAGLPVRTAVGGRSGNLWPGHSLLDAPDGPEVWTVAELTSTHLCHMDGWAGPDVGAVTCLWPDHIELHGGIDRYAAAKRRIFGGTATRVVLNHDDHDGRALLGMPEGRVATAFSQGVPLPDGVFVRDGSIHVARGGRATPVGAWGDRPRWAHPTAVLAACAAAVAAGADPQAIPAGLAAAVPLPHRGRRLPGPRGAALVDDTMAATPRKALAAIVRAPAGRTIAVVGGDAAPGGVAVHAAPDEQEAFDRACDGLGRMARLVVVFGSGGGRIADRLGDVPVVRAEDPIAAVEVALGALRDEGDELVVAPMFPMEPADRDAVAAALDAAAGR